MKEGKKYVLSFMERQTHAETTGQETVSARQHKAFRLEDAVLSARKSPFFSLVSPKGTLLAFLHALKQEGTEEARGYLSSAISGADLEEIKGVFAHAEKYRFFVKETGERMRTLSLAAAGEKEVISVGMVAEPDDFGKWKIYCIEKE